MATHYEVLGVRADADAEAIRRAYVAVAKASHPDRRQGDDPERRARAEERIRAANEAWHVLRDPDRRAAYDRSLAISAPPRAQPAAGGARPGGSGIVGARPAPPSGVVVPASQASLWRYAPIAVVLAVLVGLLVFSAYATSNDDAPDATLPRTSPPAVGECVLVAVLSGGRVPVPVTCGTQGSYRVQSWADTPRPCPTGTIPLALADQRTTLCLAPAG